MSSPSSSTTTATNGTTVSQTTTSNTTTTSSEMSSNSTTSSSTTTNSTTSSTTDSSTTTTSTTTSSSDTSTSLTTTSSSDTNTSSGPTTSPSDTTNSPSDTGSSTDSTSSSSSEESSTSTTLTTPLTTTFPTTIFTTIDGSQVTSVVQATSTISAGSIIPVGVTATGHNGARVGKIVGAVVGSLAGLTLLAVLTFFYVRHRRQKRIEKEFDGNFDPVATDKRSSTFNSVRGTVASRGHGRGPSDVGGTLPHVADDDELLEDDGMGGRLAPSIIGAGVISPFTARPSTPPPHSSSLSRTSADEPRRLSSERGHYNAGGPGSISPQTTGSGSSGYNPYAGYSGHPPPVPVPVSMLQRRSISPNSSHPPSSFLYTGVNGPGSESGSEYTPSQSSVTSSRSAAAAAKEREAAQSSGFAVANPDPDSNNPFFPGGTGTGTVTREQRESYLRSGPSPRSPTFPRPHSVEPSEEMTEIPPTYDSLPKD